MDSVLRMQELQYLNIAINNITRIENLHRCESLTRLDMTMEFRGQVSSRLSWTTSRA